MKPIIYKICLGLTFIACIFSCRKTDYFQNSYSSQQPVNEKIKAWLSEQPGFMNYQNFFADGRSIVVEERLGWEESAYYPEFKMNITPVYIKSVKEIPLKFKYLVTNFDDNGRVINGNYYVVFFDKRNQHLYKTKANIAPEIFDTEKMSPEFVGAVIKYDLQNKKLMSKHSDSTSSTEFLDVVAVRKSKMQVPAENIAPPGEGCVYVTIDWYWQTWENGILVYEEYIGSSNVLECEGSGGSGGGGNGGLTCEQQNQNFLNYGIAFSGPIAHSDEFNNGLIWIKKYNWPIYKASTWALFSYERGTLEKVYYHAGQSRWEFQSFEHLHISEVGTNIGGTRTYNDLGASINITPTRMSAWVNVDFSVTSRATCWPYPTTLAYSSNKTFYAPNSVVYQ